MTKKASLSGNRTSLPQAKVFRARMLAVCVAVALNLVVFHACADEVVMQNGDHYYGKVLSLTTNSLLLQSEVLGNVNLPRVKVKLVNLGTNAPSNAARPTPTSLRDVPSRLPKQSDKNDTSDLPATLRGLQADTNLVRQVQAEFLGAATPEANLKFNQTLNGLANGTLTMNDLRGEARSAAEQLRASKRELGPDAGDEIDGYLDILDRFLRETESSVSVPAKPASTTPGRRAVK